MPLKTNEFNYRINPLNPSLITLELSKKSKRNLRVRRLSLIGINVALALVMIGIGQVAERKLDAEIEENLNDLED